MQDLSTGSVQMESQQLSIAGLLVVQQQPGLWCVSMTLMSVLPGGILMAAKKTGRHAACQIKTLLKFDVRDLQEAKCFLEMRTNCHKPEDWW